MDKQQGRDRVIEGRSIDVFLTHKSIVDSYAEHIGIGGLAVYTVLARCVGDGKTNPSVRYMAKLLGASTNTILKYLHTLESNHLVGMNHRDGDSTEYILLTPSNSPYLGVSENETPRQQPGFGTVSENETPVSENETPVSLPSLSDSPSSLKPKDLNQDLKTQTPLSYSPQPENPGMGVGGEDTKSYTAFEALFAPASENKTAEAQEVMEHLNHTTGRTYHQPGYILKGLRAGQTMEQQKLVIDWWKAVKIVLSPHQDQHFNTTTPFREEHFDNYLAAATQWDQRGRLSALETLPQAARMSKDDERLASMLADAKELLEEAGFGKPPVRHLPWGLNGHGYDLQG